VIASAPGKLILTGEYAVLDGAPALVAAMNRRVVARRHAGPRGSSPFLVAVADEIGKRLGADHLSARAALEIAVDSSAFYAGTMKLGLGSSAAVTVAATALALAADHAVVPVLDRDQILAIASAAHAAAQGARGRESSGDLTRQLPKRSQHARGSGADIASAVYGGLIAFSRGGPITPLAWPRGVTLLPFFTGASADTVSLVEAVDAARERDPAAVTAALAAIEKASRAACQACAARAPEIAGRALLSALALAAHATDQLAAATRLPLVPSTVTAARTALTRLGGTAKTTGAGGGDIAVGVIPGTEDVTVARRYLIEAGCQPLHLAVDETGVDLQPDEQ
jgi:phosphomevalonate kinase